MKYESSTKLEISTFLKENELYFEENDTKKQFLEVLQVCKKFFKTYINKLYITAAGRH